MKENKNDNNEYIKNDNNEYIMITHRLKTSNINHIDFMGIVSYVIYSKQIFPKNKDIVKFLKAVFELSYHDYVIKSRTLITARLTRYIYSLEQRDLENSVGNMYNYIININMNMSADSISNKSKYKKSNANDKLEKWLKEL